MTTTPAETARTESRFVRLIAGVTALSRHRRLVMALVAVAIAAALVVDTAFPSYPIAGFYLVPVTIAALTTRVRSTLLVGLVCLGLGLGVITVYDRWDGPTVTVVCFGVLGGAMLIVLSFLLRRVEEAYEAERSTRAVLESLAAQLQTLQEVVVLDHDRPLSALLAEVMGRAMELSRSDGCLVYRYDGEQDALVRAAVAGRSAGEDLLPLTRQEHPVVRVHLTGAPAAQEHGPGGGGLLAVPLLVRAEAYGVLVLTYAAQRGFNDLDVRLAASFGGQAALAIENARLRDEVRQAAAAGERSRLARDLHDSVTQALFAASLKAEAVRRRWRPGSDEARANVEDLERLTRGALAEMRTLLLEMRSDALAETSLVRLLELLAAATEGGSRIEVHLDPGQVEGLPRRVSLALFRVAQEALQNVNRHSGAHRAWVMLESERDEVRLTVRDDGCGFEPSAVAAEHLGLRIMREDAADAGVRVQVESARGAGATVTAVWRNEELEA